MEYQTHYNMSRPHQGIAQHVPDADRDTPPRHRDRPQHRTDPPKTYPGGLINEYTHAA
jgi:hypothetical protein